MQHQAQGEKHPQEYNSFPPAKQGIVPCQDAQQDEDFLKLVPFGLQGMRFDEIHIVLD